MLYNLSEAFAEIAASVPPPLDEPQTGAQRQKKHKAKLRKQRHEDIAVLDMETDPFDHVSRAEIKPFCAELYTEEFGKVVIWEDDYETLVNRVLSAINDLPRSFTVYAHNGGRFDYMFLIHKLRGDISFKGRGIMRATVGNHELRDSYHVLPERLAAMQKEKFDYVNKLTKANRDNCRQEIEDYLHSDCVNLMYFIKRFIDMYGFKISIGAAAIQKLKETCRVESVAPYTDVMIRPFYYGGRVECIAGAGVFDGDFKLYDVNSMYPFVMATYKHPIGSQYIPREGEPNKFTAFVKLRCRNDRALVARDAEGNLTTDVREGEFLATIHEYNTALELGLISDVTILECVDCFNWSSFEKFVQPLYDQRAAAKADLLTLKKGTEEHLRVKSEVLFLKLILNNAYGKFAQNPRRFREHYITDAGVRPEIIEGTPDMWGDMPEYMGADHWIWSKPTENIRFLNVGTAASITGAARSVLLRAIVGAKNPLYCDTDSLICEELTGQKMHATELGAWDMECAITSLAVAGKKLYAYKSPDADEPIVKSKGASGLSYNDIVDLVAGRSKAAINRAPTLTRFGEQYYIERRVRRTASRQAAT